MNQDILLHVTAIMSRGKAMIQKIVRDSVKTILLGVTISAVLFVLLWLIGTLTSGWDVTAGFETARAGMFIAGALGLFMLAGSNLFFGQMHEWKHKEAWEKMYSVFSYKAVLGIASLVVLIIASTLDYVMYYL